MDVVVGRSDCRCWVVVRGEVVDAELSNLIGGGGVAHTGGAVNTGGALSAERVVVVVGSWVGPVGGARGGPGVACCGASRLVALAVAGGALHAGDGPWLEIPFGGSFAVSLGVARLFPGVARFALAFLEGLIVPVSC